MRMSETAATKNKCRRDDEFGDVDFAEGWSLGRDYLIAHSTPLGVLFSCCPSTSLAVGRCDAGCRVTRPRKRGLGRSARGAPGSRHPGSGAGVKCYSTRCIPWAPRAGGFRQTRSCGLGIQAVSSRSRAPHTRYAQGAARRTDQFRDSKGRSLFEKVLAEDAAPILLQETGRFVRIWPRKDRCEWHNRVPGASASTLPSPIDRCFFDQRSLREPSVEADEFARLFNVRTTPTY